MKLILPQRIITQARRKKLQDKAVLEQQQQFREFMNTLNELVSKDKISAEELGHIRANGTTIRKTGKSWLISIISSEQIESVNLPG